MKIGFVSLGCPKNLVDSEVMMGLSQEGGHTLTPNPAEADVLVVNTCAFIDSAKEESVNTILELAEFKKTGACKRLVVTGCLGERYRDELKAQIPEIDAVLGTGDVPEIVGAIEGARRTTIPLRLVNESRIPSPESRLPNPESRIPNPGSRSLPTYLYDAETPRVFATPRHFAYVKVAEGCDYKCSFCIIPTLRGHYRSRPIDTIVREARALAARGVREIILISQDTTFYGRDLGQGAALAQLLRTLNEVEGIDWIRLLYLYPTTITDDILDAMEASEKVCNYIDLPLQHASEDVLRRMKRPGTGASYEALLANIRARVPGVALRTTLIVGFPGETEAEFAELLGFVRRVRFDHVGVFTYSHEEGTTAYGLADDVPAAVKRKRRNRLMAEQKKIVARAQKARIGSRVQVMVEGPSPEHELVWRGRLAGQAPDIDPMVYLTDVDPETLRPGLLLEAEIVGAREYDLLARLRAPEC
ncbi:MAG TPA: 30S ribosomal protein S12 methylthiotransferase RimO [Vicinamibacterales bacterium]|nr:30S ribosomal protein S12 methylthiotransferase RimO [Vicinamibacterales bacterium]